MPLQEVESVLGESEQERKDIRDKYIALGEKVELLLHQEERVKSSAERDTQAAKMAVKEAVSDLEMVGPLSSPRPPPPPALAAPAASVLSACDGGLPCPFPATCLPLRHTRILSSLSQAAELSTNFPLIIASDMTCAFLSACQSCHCWSKDCRAMCAYTVCKERTQSFAGFAG